MNLIKKKYLNKEIVVLFLISIIILKNIFSGVNLSTDFIERYDYAANILDAGIRNGVAFEFYRLSAFDWLHFGYILVCFSFKSIFGPSYYNFIVVFQNILSVYSIILCLKYLIDFEKKILFLIIYILIPELNQWENWLTPDSIFRSCILIYFFHYLSNKNISFNITIIVILVLTSFRMEAILYFLPVVYHDIFKLRDTRNLRVNIYKFAFVIIVLFFLMYRPISNLLVKFYLNGIVVGGLPTELIKLNFTHLDRLSFESEWSYFISLYGLRFLNAAFLISPIWSIKHIVYQVIMLSSFALFFLKKGVIFNGMFKWIMGIYLLLIALQMVFAVDPTLRYFYTIYTMLAIYLCKNIKNSHFFKTKDF